MTAKITSGCKELCKKLMDPARFQICKFGDQSPKYQELPDMGKRPRSNMINALIKHGLIEFERHTPTLSVAKLTSKGLLVAHGEYKERPAPPLPVPSAEEIKAARLAANLTQKQAAVYAMCSHRVWQEYEQPGKRAINPQAWALFRAKTAKPAKSAEGVVSALRSLLHAFHSLKEQIGAPRGINLIHWQRAHEALEAFDKDNSPPVKFSQQIITSAEIKKSP